MLSAQTKNVSGRILSAENDEPIAGATVLVKGTSIGVASDAHGHFTLKVPESCYRINSFVYGNGNTGSGNQSESDDSVEVCQREIG